MVFQLRSVLVLKTFDPDYFGFSIDAHKDMLGRRRGGEPRLFWSSRLGNVCGNARAMPKYLVGGLSNQVLTCHCHPLEKVTSSSS